MTYQTALITGAGGGLGKALAVELAREGTAIAAIDLRPEGLESLADTLKRENRKCAWALADVTDAPALKDKVAQLQKELGPIDLMIANAGLGYETSALSFHMENMANLIQVNLVGVSNSVGAVLPDMLQRRRGHLVAISSLASFRGMPLMLAYCASKAGVNALMEGLRVEVKPFGLAVSTICPGWIRTPMTASIQDAIPFLFEPEQAARIILGAVRKRKTFFAFPRAMAWQMRLLGWLPNFISDWLVMKMVRKLQQTKLSRELTGQFQKAKGN